MPEEIDIELTEMPCADSQYILSYGDLRHIGYVQKKTGFIQLIDRVGASVFAEIKEKVESKLKMGELPISQPPETPEWMNGAEEYES
jgi:hypothetical protein